MPSSTSVLFISISIAVFKLTAIKSLVFPSSFSSPTCFSSIISTLIRTVVSAVVDGAVDVDFTLTSASIIGFSLELSIIIGISSFSLLISCFFSSFKSLFRIAFLKFYQNS